jgi:hypothetical protein
MVSADEVEEIFKQLNVLKKDYSKETIDLIPEFEQFRTEQKLFYETILKEDMDPTIFKQMMKMKRRLESGEDSYGVDVKFGKFMAEKFIDPIVKK